MKERLAVPGKILLSLVIMIVLISIGSALLQASDTDSSVAEMLVSSISLLIATALMFNLFDKKKGWSLGLKQPRFALNIFRGLGLGILLISLSFLGIWGLGGLEIESTQFDGDTLAGVLSSFGAFILVAPIVTISPHGGTYLSGGDFGAEGSTVVTVLMLIVFAIAVRLTRRSESGIAPRAIGWQGLPKV